MTRLQRTKKGTGKGVTPGFPRLGCLGGGSLL